MKRIVILSSAFLAFSAFNAVSGPSICKISVSQIVQHPSLDAMRQGIMDYLAEQGIPVEYNVHIADGSPQPTCR